MLRKRDGRLQAFNKAKLVKAVQQSFHVARTGNGYASRQIVNRVEDRLKQTYKNIIPSTEDVLHLVHEELMEKGFIDVANAYILYFQSTSKRERIKEFFGVRDDLRLGMNAMWLLADRYLQRNNKGAIVETPSQLLRRVARAIARVDKRYGKTAKDLAHTQEWFYDIMANKAFLPNTPTLMNAGLPKGQLAACFVLPLKDSVSEIFSTMKTMAEIQKTSGGTGFDFSEIRSKGSLVESTGARASGPISFIQLFNDASEVMKQGGKRSGANMGVLRVDHPDIERFIASKKEEEVLKNFNLSVGVTDQFLCAVNARMQYSIVDPQTKKVVGKKDAKAVFDQIVTHAWKNGDPGLLFLDQINRKNPTKHLGKIAATNPCGEQPLHPNEACTLGSINLAAFLKGVPTKGEIDWGLLRQVVQGAVHFLDNTLDASAYPNKKIKEATLGNRRIGLGIMGFAEALAHIGVSYDSAQAIVEAERVMKFIKQEAERASLQLARERGVFPNYKGSMHEKKKKRLRNATLTTIAPTGSISLLAQCSSGIEPLFAVSFVRKSASGIGLMEASALFERTARHFGFWDSHLLDQIAKTGSVQGNKKVPKRIQQLFKTALEIPVSQHVAIQAAFQKHTDSAVSKTINLPKNARKKDVAAAYLQAWESKCKGVTVYRYGSRKGQILSLGEIKHAGERPFLVAASEFVGGCPSGACVR
jgi:ribonucleoside-diphosphate reductase alpha chain